VVLIHNTSATIPPNAFVFASRYPKASALGLIRPVKMRAEEGAEEGAFLFEMG
jgi:hypothetical protein